MESARVGVLAALTLAVIAGGLYGIYALGSDCGFSSECEYDSYYALDAEAADGRGFVYHATLEDGAIVKERAVWKGATPATTHATSNDAARGNDTVEFTLSVNMNGIHRDTAHFSLPDGSGVIYWDSHAQDTRVTAGDVFDVAITRGDDDGPVHRARIHVEP